MKRIEFLKNDLTGVPLPQEGYKTIGIDSDGIVKTIDDQGNIEGIGGSSFGKLGISNANGEYTYYDTLALAVAAYTAGDVIELFSNITQAAIVDLPNGCFLNGNGYEIENTSTDYTLSVTGGNEVKISNLIINATAATGKGITLSGANSTLRCSDSVFVNTVSGDAATVGANANLIGGNYYRATTNNVITNNGGNVENVRASGQYGIRCAGGTIRDSFCNGTLIGFDLASGAVAHNVLGYSNNGNGIFANNAKVFNSGGISNLSQGCYGETDSVWYDCQAYSISQIAWGGTSTIRSQQLKGCSAHALVNYAFSGRAFIKGGNWESEGLAAINLLLGVIEDANVESKYNNSAGHGIIFVSDNLEANNNTIKVANASANCLNSGSAYNLYYAGNRYKGATTPVNANLTQAIVNNEDNQGNIQII